MTAVVQAAASAINLALRPLPIRLSVGNGLFREVRMMLPVGPTAISLKLSQPLLRHARACRGHPRLAFQCAAAKKDVDGRDKPGHDVER